MAIVDQIPSPKPMKPLPPPAQTFSAKLKAHKKAIIISSVGFILLLSMTFYLLSPLRNTLVSPANFPTPAAFTSPPSKSPVSPTISLTPTPNPLVASWKTYTNTVYKYSIKYPPDWSARDLGALEPKIPSYIAFNATSAPQSARHITIAATTRTYEEQLALGASSSAITAAGVSGTRQYFQDSDGNTSTAIILPGGNSLIVLRAKTAYLSTLNLMLSTLIITN